MKSDKDIEDIYPLSDIQRGMVYYSMKNPEIFPYHNQTMLYLKQGDFDHARLKKAISLLVDKHPMLRTGFNMFDYEQPVQIVFNTIDHYDIEHIDIKHLEEQGQRDFILRLLAEDRQKPFDFSNEQSLWRVKTCDLDHGRICFIWICHHSIIDGWGFATLMSELNEVYLKLKTDPHYVPRKLAISYKDFVVDQIVEKKKPGNSEFWKKELAGYRRLDFSRFMKGSYSGIQQGFSRDIGIDFLDKLRDTGSRHDRSVRTLCFAAYLYMLCMFLSEEEIVVGLVTDNRPVHEDGADVIGCFLNSVPFRINIPEKIRWREYIDMVHHKLLQIKKYDRLPLFEIARIIGEKSRGQNPIFDAQFNLVDFHAYHRPRSYDYDRPDGPVDTQMYGIAGAGTTNILLDCIIDISFGRFMFNLTFEESLMSGEVARCLYIYFKSILTKMIAEPDNVAEKAKISAWIDQENNLSGLSLPKQATPDIDFKF